MSEDSAHGQHFEPGNGAAVPAPSIEQLLEAQAHRVEELGTRVASLISASLDAFNDFVIAQQSFFITLTERTPSDPTNPDTPQTNAGGKV